MKFELSRIIRANNVITIYPKEGPKVVIPIQGLPIQADRVFAELVAMFGLSTSSNPKAPPQDLCSHKGEAPQGLLDALYDPCTCPGCGIGVNPEPSGLCPICDTQLR